MAMTRPVTVNDILEGHVVLDLDCLDRVYLGAYVPNLQVGGQVVTFLTRHLGNPIPSPAIFDKIGTAERQREPITLYRGVPDEGRHGMAWTSDRTVAERFASGMLLRNYGQAGRVWVETVEPWRLLAALDRREEAEHVIDTDGLDVAPMHARRPSGGGPGDRM